MNTDVQLTRQDIEQLPGFKKHSADQYTASLCPICGAGEDRFCFWPDKGNYWCRRCDLKGFISDTSTLALSREDFLKWQEQETERKRQEAQQRQSTLDRLAQSGKVAQYHQQMADRSFWYTYGLTDEAIDYFELGYCPSCPTLPGHDSYTIPISYQGKLYNIRHRLTSPNGSGKYRPEMTGLPNCMFNADALHKANEWQVVLVEGEVKAMVLEQYGFNAVGIPGANSFKQKWARLFNSSKQVHIVLDPGAEAQALEIARILQSQAEVRVCQLPVKPDDFFVLYGGNASDFMKFLMLGEKVNRD